VLRDARVLSRARPPANNDVEGEAMAKPEAAANSHRRSLTRITGSVPRHPVLVVLVWVFLGALTNLAWPQLNTVIAQQSPTILPAGAKSIQMFDTMANAFGEQGGQNSAIVAVTGPDGFSPAAQKVHRSLVERLSNTKPDVLSVTDLVSDERTRSIALSKDGRVWMLTARLRGDPGSPETAQSVAVMRKAVRDTLVGSGLEAFVTGPPGTIADALGASETALTKITLMTGLLIGIILLIIYRSVLTAALPVLAVGVGLGVARGVVAGCGLLGMPVSFNSQALMTVVGAAVGIDYSVFLISRYHERIRSGVGATEALVCAGSTVGPVIVASAATMIAGSVAMAFAKLAPLASAGPMLVIGIVFACSCALTLVPALLALAARRGRGMPKPERTYRYWHGVGLAVTRRPARMLAVSLVGLVALAGPVAFIRPGYDDRVGIPAELESNRGYALLAAHFPRDLLFPQYLLIRSDTDLRTSKGLADLEQMASRVAQLPGVTAVRGITRPDAHKLTEATLAWQIGQVGQRMDQAVGDSARYRNELDKFTDGLRLLKEAMSGLSPSDIDRLLTAAPAMVASAAEAKDALDKYRPVIDRLAASPALLDAADWTLARLDDLSAKFDRVSSLLAPVTRALEQAPWCTDIDQCAQLREQLQELDQMREAGVFHDVFLLRDEIRSTADGQSLKELASQLRQMLDSMSGQVSAPDLTVFKSRLDRLSSLYRKLRNLGLTDVDALSQMVNEMNSRSGEVFNGLDQAASYFRNVGRDASSPASSGFYVPADLIENPDFKTAARLFTSPDGKTVRYLVTSEINPYSEESMRLVDRITETAEGALPNTSLAGSSVGVAGFPSVIADLKHYYDRDFRFIVIATLAVIFIILAVLLRAVVAPIYLLLTMALTYLSALGAGVILFQEVLGQRLFWLVPAMTLILLVAVGVDYNMLLVARLREETTDSVKAGVIRTVGNTGAVITSAGMIFAASMFGLVVGGLTVLTQVGCIIGFGILLDTFLVRTITVPAIATLLGRYSWWPSKLS
jgi:RND superfamily putative drug exporter